MPTNSGLRYVREQGLAKILERISNPTIREVRGEKIPEIVNKAKSSSVVYGVTGEDLFLNYCIGSQYDREINNRESNKIVVIERLNLLGTGPYATSVFGLPTLCVLGRKGLPPKEYAALFGGVWKEEYLPDFNGRKDIVIAKKYKNLIYERTNWFENNSRLFWPETLFVKALDGQVDVTAAQDPSVDYAIDIVVTGKTCEKLGLGIYASLCRSDGLIIGTSAALKFWKEIELKQII